MRAFIFSLDAFVAITLALVAIYSLIFFSSIPSSYYYLLTQGHYLARDVLFSASTSDCETLPPVFPPQSCQIKGSVLDNIVFGDADFQKNFMNDTIRQSIGLAVPTQFGYVLEVSSDNGASWSKLYDTALGDDPQNQHAAVQRKMSVSSQVVAFDYSGTLAKNAPNPYLYTTCMGTGGGAGGDSHVLLTCSQLPASSQYGGGADTGNDIVPAAGIRLVRITIFI